ncbi:Uridine kinase [wastewater metagenome]|uniref:phosphoribulokinase n=2 Tax=unclassified sequences TaxID=12908 RepID=A0A5B8RF62_9ZZZZ|nr:MULTISPECIES: phosphoribulokinase [Arhodomonas]MCS4504566.1 phosphoribulokinase [Arhodomonas aquaeolei]QEA05475.1 uridine kinase [uncultured organism]
MPHGPERPRQPEADGLDGDLRALLAAARRPVVVGVAGDSGSGKSTYAHGIRRLLGNEMVATLTLDGYHKEDRAARRRSGRSPLDPRANHLPRVREHLAALREWQPVEIPTYDHVSGRFGETQLFRPTPVIVVEGLHALYPEFLPLLDFRLFVDPEREVKRRWKLERDVHRRGYTPEEARAEMDRREAHYQRWIDFQKANADVIVRINESELSALAVDELQGQIPEHCHHMEIIVTPTETPLPPLHLPVDLNAMTRRQALPFMLANVPSSFWGRAVNVVHIDGALPVQALARLESDIMRLTGIETDGDTDVADEASTIVFTQLLVAWPFLGHVHALLRRRGREADGDAEE